MCGKTASDRGEVEEVHDVNTDLSLCVFEEAYVGYNVSTH